MKRTNGIERKQNNVQQSHLQKAHQATRRILLLAAPQTQILDLVGPFQVFTRATQIIAREHKDLPPLYCVEVVTSTRQKWLVTSCGLRVEAHHTFKRVTGKIDTLLIAGGGAIENEDTGPELTRWLRKVATQSRRIGSVCTGAFLLARTGLLNGRRVTTHWRFAEFLATTFPKLQVDPDPIFIRDGNVYTSAGVTAGMDLALALIEEDHGSRLALQVARELVLYLRRPGSQSQFSAALSMQITDREPLRELEAWVLDNLSKPLRVEILAERVAMSPRNFALVFTKEMNITPARFIERLRVETARRRLEESQDSIKKIAADCGFGNVNSMRTVFQRSLRIAPGQYRQRFHALQKAK